MFGRVPQHLRRISEHAQGEKCIVAFSCIYSYFVYLLFKCKTQQTQSLLLNIFGKEKNTQKIYYWPEQSTAQGATECQEIWSTPSFLLPQLFKAASSLEHIVNEDHEKQISLKQKVGFLTSEEFFTDSFVDKF